MGAYLSEPITDKISTDEANNRLAWGTSSMQGWRMSQEDAHNCITDYDENTSYFAVYDGHGGAEVATYCALKLPDFIKQTEAYKNGDMSQALIDGYLGFDGTIINKEVIEKLRELAGNKQNTDIEEEDGDDNLLSLKKEALTPLEQIMAKYRQKGLNIPRIVRVEEGDPSSVSMPSKGKGKKSNCEDAAGCSGDNQKASSAGKSDVNDGVSSSTTEGNKPGPSADSQVSTSNGETSKVGASSSKNTDDAVTESTSKTSENSLPDSSNDNCAKPATSDYKVTSPDDSPVTPTTSDDTKNVPDSKSEITIKEVTQSIDEVTCNGEAVESTKSGDKVSSSSQDAEVATKNASIKGKGKAKAVVSSSDSPEKTDDKESPSKRTKRAAALYNNLLISSEDDEDSDSNDETFKGQDEASSSDETEVNGIENGSSGDDDDDDDVEGEEDSSDEEEEDEDSEEYDDINLTGSDEPGLDSGCTAVVAILKGDQLYVANAGDSRCVVCRDGQAVDMSLDHKPEDPLELARVEKAGGKVNGDGRINGGLNLSRAIGDHSYKQNKDLDDKEQMITALPDIKTLTVNPETDNFMVLACDGIWNFMTSQEVIDFVGERLKDESKSLSAICEELFDKCLAPTTLGDGTGCDNMTAIVIKFKKSLESAASDIPVESSKKRPVDDTDESAPKRQKTDDESVMSAAVTSSE